MNSDLIKSRQDITSFGEIASQYLDAYPSPKITLPHLVDVISEADSLLTLIKEFYEEKIILCVIISKLTTN